MKKLLTLLMSAWLVGCSAIPENLRVAENTELVAFDDVRAQPTLFTNMQARWGGLVAKVDVKADHTQLEVVNMSLKDNSSRPKVEQQTAGRFRVKVPGLLDPIVFKEGRSVTILGIVEPSETGMIGEQEYLYPTLSVDSAKQVYLWKEIKEVKVDTFHSPYWMYPSRWHYYPSRRVVIRSTSAAPVKKSSK